MMKYIKTLQNPQHPNTNQPKLSNISMMSSQGIVDEIKTASYVFSSVVNDWNVKTKKPRNVPEKWSRWLDLTATKLGMVNNEHEHSWRILSAMEVVVNKMLEYHPNDSEVWIRFENDDDSVNEDVNEFFAIYERIDDSTDMSKFRKVSTIYEIKKRSDEYNANWA